MADNAESLAKLKIELENVKKRIEEIESITYASRSVEDKKTYNLLLEEKTSLKGDIKSLEGLLSIVSRFTNVPWIVFPRARCWASRAIWMLRWRWEYVVR